MKTLTIGSTRLTAMGRRLAAVCACAVLGAAVGLGGTLTAAAQTEPVPTATPESLLADMYARLAIAAMSDGGEGDLRPDQITRASVLLDMAVELRPRDADLLALRINLARNAGDPAALRALLEQYVQLRPQDDAKRYELIMLTVTESETLDGRLALLEDYLRQAEGDPNYTDALVSRLASAGALAARELADQPKFIELLKVAVRADASNGEAAALMHELALRQEASPLQLGAVAVNLVKARPIDSDARLLLAGALGSVGAFNQAVQQYDVATKLPRSGPLPATAMASWARCLVATGRMEEAGTLIDEIEKFYAGNSEAGVEAQPLPVEFLILRRVIAGEGEAGTAAYQKIVEALQPRVDAGDQDAALELAWIKAIFGPDTQEASALLQGRDQSDPRYQRATGFVFLREGSDRWARQAFEQVEQDDPVSAYGLAQLRGRDEAGVARYLREVVVQSPDSMGGLLAARQLQEMRRVIEPGPHAKALTTLMDKSPAGLWRFDINQNPWVGLRFEFVQMTHPFLEPMRVRVRMQNMLGLPLPLNAREGIGTTAFVSLAAYAQGRPIGDVPPVVLDLGRRLSLRPGETLEIETRLDRSLFGLLFASGKVPSLAFNATLLLDPRFAPNGTMTTGVLGAVETVRSVQAFVPTANPESLARWADDLGSGDAATRFTAAARLAQIGENLTDSAIEPALSRRCIEALARHYESAGPLDKTWIMLQLNADENVSRSEFRGILEQAQRSDDPAVRIAYLLKQVRSADDQSLTTAIRDGSPRVQRFAQALKEMLAQPPAPPESRSPESPSPESPSP